MLTIPLEHPIGKKLHQAMLSRAFATLEAAFGDVIPSGIFVRVDDDAGILDDETDKDTD